MIFKVYSYYLPGKDLFIPVLLSTCIVYVFGAVNLGYYFLFGAGG